MTELDPSLRPAPRHHAPAQGPSLTPNVVPFRRPALPPLPVPARPPDNPSSPSAA